MKPAFVASALDWLREALAVVARAVGLPACDCCDTVHWHGTKHAYDAGWRSQTDGVGPDFWSVRCPDCQDQDRDDPRWM